MGHRDSQVFKGQQGQQGQQEQQEFRDLQEPTVQMAHREFKVFEETPDLLVLISTSYHLFLGVRYS